MHVCSENADYLHTFVCVPIACILDPAIYVFVFCFLSAINCLARIVAT